MRSKSLFAELVSEFFGTFILILFGAGVVAMVQLFGSGIPGEIVHGGWTNITFAWGLGVVLGIYTSQRSGAHINPAVTLSFALLKGFPWRKVAPYCAAQVAGAFCGAALVFLNYKEALLKFDPNLEKTAGIFTTFPAFPGLPVAGFFDQVVGTALLLFLVLVIIDHAPPSLQPLLIGGAVVAIGMSWGGLHGYAINPARDFGPRLFTALAGFKNNGLTDGTGVFWVPIAGPFLGGAIGAFIYMQCIRRFAAKP
ncbi:MAG: aquaporin family protein [Bryobacteraceae bacterium]|nr:aquaporin family protein [Bryobacteraceae bacterium]